MDTWVHTYRNSAWAREMHSHTYKATQRRLTNRLLERAHVLVGCAAHDDQQIYGWLCGETHASRFCLHYVWVHHAMRGMGIGRSLVRRFLVDTEPDMPGVVSHLSDAARALAMQNRIRIPQLTCSYRPYLRYNPMLSVDPDVEVAL